MIKLITNFIIFVVMIICIEVAAVADVEDNDDNASIMAVDSELPAMSQGNSSLFNLYFLFIRCSPRCQS